MATNSDISWTHHTFNPWIGCTKISPGCAHCYACYQADRLGRIATWSKGKHLAVWGPNQARYVPATTGEQQRVLLGRNAALAGTGQRERVFCASMADVFEATTDPAVVKARTNLWDLIAQTPNLDWLLLSKRPQNIAQLIPASWLTKPLKNVWLGTSAENQAYADIRIPQLLSVPAHVRFVSCEPLLGPIDLARHLGDAMVNWVIAGGESGPGHRAMDLDWARSLREQVLDSHQHFHFKQVGGATPKSGGHTLDGVTWHHYPDGVPSVVKWLMQV